MEPRSAPSQDRRVPSSWALISADALALLAFVLTGAASHHDASLGTILARNLVPIGLAWVIAALAFSAYQRRSWASLLVTWAVAVPMGIVVRSWWVGDPRGSGLVTFLLVGSGFALLYLVVGRALLIAGTRFRVREHAA